MSQVKIKHYIFATFSVLITLQFMGCGVSKSSSDGVGVPAANAVNVVGVAGAGKPIRGRVFLKDRLGNVRQGNTTAQGNFSISVTGLTAPFRLKAVGTSAGVDQTLYSLAEGPGTAHINPLSNIAIAAAANAANLDAGFFESANGLVVSTANLTTAVNNLKNNLLQTLEAEGYTGANIDPIKGAYAANGAGLDRVFDFVDIKLNSTSGAMSVKSRIDQRVIAAVATNNLQGLANQVQRGNITSLNNRTASEIANLIPTIGLSVAKEMSVVNAKKPGSTSQSRGIAFSNLRLALSSALSTVPLTSDYYNDEVHYYVEEESLEPLDMINEILCAMDQTSYDEMVNKGAYAAQINNELCDSDKDSSSSGGNQGRNQTSGANQPDFEIWKVLSERANNDADHVVRVWIKENEGGSEDPPQEIQARTVITEGSSESNPYGLFTMNFVAYPIDSQGNVDTTTENFRGFLKTVRETSDGKVLIKFAMNGGFTFSEGSVSVNQLVVLDQDPETESGKGRIVNNEVQSFPQFLREENDDFSVAFNQSSFLRVDDEVACFNRNSYHETAWRYNLYDTQGQRVRRNSGFPIAFNDGSKVHYGWIGYWGIWFEESVNLANGSSVVKKSHNQEEQDQTFTVFKAPGKLIRHTRQSTTLGEIRNVPMNFHEQSQQGPGAEYQVVWNGTSLVKTHLRNQETGFWQEISPPQAIVFDDNSYDFWFWSESLGGSGNVKLRDDQGQLVLPANTSVVNFNTEMVVYPDDPQLPSSLICYENCPNSAVINQPGSDPFHNANNLQGVAPDQATSYVYTVNASTLGLQEGSTVVEMNVNNSQYHWGIHSGPMITSDQVSNLACDWDANQTCTFKIWDSIQTYYTWETGTNPWNRFTALRNPSNNEFLSFDPPLRVNYTHTNTDSTTSKYSLEYNGFGDLHGIPGKCINPETGEDAQCNEKSRWIPAFSIPEGSAAMMGETEYIVKALDVEQRMRQVSSASCSSLSTQAFTLPSLSEWVNPSNGTSPTIQAAPAVIGGEVQR